MLRLAKFFAQHILVLYKQIATFYVHKNFHIKIPCIQDMSPFRIFVFLLKPQTIIISDMGANKPQPRKHSEGLPRTALDSGAQDTDCADICT